MKSEIIHPIIGKITLSSTRLNRRISLSVRPSGEVRLSFPLFVSQQRALQFLEQKVDWILASRQRCLARNNTPAISPEEREALRAKAKAYLPERVAQLAQIYGLNYGKVTIRATRSKWGSCTWQNNISLSLYLMMLPSHLIDYVIIHELCHTKHHNHSAAFHALVNSLVGGREQQLKRELRQHSINIE